MDVKVPFSAGAGGPAVAMGLVVPEPLGLGESGLCSCGGAGSDKGASWGGPADPTRLATRYRRFNSPLLTPPR